MSQTEGKITQKKASVKKSTRQSLSGVNTSHNNINPSDLEAAIKMHQQMLKEEEERQLKQEQDEKDRLKRDILNRRDQYYKRSDLQKKQEDLLYDKQIRQHRDRYRAGEKSIFVNN